MGTRNLVIVYYKGKPYIAQYCQWDGYPEGQGKTVLEFVSDAGNLEKLKRAFDNNMCHWVTDAELEKLAGKFAHNDLINKSPEVGYNINNTGGEILEVVANATKPIPLVDELDFIYQVFYCEWAYVLDLDNEELEVYASMEMINIGEGRFDLHPRPRLVGKWQLTELPTLKDFLRFFQEQQNEKIEEEEEEGEEDEEDTVRGRWSTAGTGQVKDVE